VRAEEPADGGVPVGCEPGWYATSFDFMKLLSCTAGHDLRDETLNAYGQFTYISSWKLPFGAKYTNLNGTPNSLITEPERSFTGTGTIYLGLRPWPGAELYFVPEVIAERPLSNLTGLGSAIQNFELQKTGAETPTLYRSRLYLTQTFNFGGARVQKESHAMQLGGTVDARRLVVNLGNFSVLDFMDKNTYAGELRKQWFDMAFMTHAAYDFAADARGYSWGAVVEAYFDDWALRFGHLTPPINPNQLEVDFRLFEFFGQQLELEHTHTLFGRPGSVRLLGFRNRENMARFDDAIAAFQADPTKNAAACDAALRFHYGSQNETAPDLCWARKPNVKLGVGLNAEQEVLSGVGVFLRAMWADGETEVYSYTSTDRSFSFGVLGKGGLWNRPGDSAGVAFQAGFISKTHADFLALGGVDGFIGDGRLTAAAELVFEVFYSVNLYSSLWVAGSYVHIANPGFNADRGPVDVFGLKVHAEF
jgi:hypothetical protein